MARLTERFSNGQAAVHGCGNNCKYDYKYCESHLEDCPTISEIYEKLAEYEDLEEQGKLLKLPCVVGDTVFEIYEGEIIERIVRGILFRGGELLGQDGNGSIFGIFGKTVFLTRQEAEDKLAEMEGKK